MLDAFDVDEFRMSYGDPRPIMHNYLLSAYPSVFTSPLGGEVSSFSLPEVITYKCDPVYSAETGKDRPTRLPVSQVAQGAFKAALTQTRKPLVILPAVAVNKNRCAWSKNTDRHVCYYVYNSNTGELERLDLKKHALDGFKMRILDRHAPGLIRGLAGSAQVNILGELEMPAMLRERFNSGRTTAHFYPIFLLMYLEMRALHPTEMRKDILRRMNACTEEDFASVWNKFIRFRNIVVAAGTTAPCPSAGLVRNPANNLCIKHNNKEYAIEPPAAQCLLGKVENPVSGRCVAPQNAVHVKMFTREAGRFRARVGEKIEHIDNSKLAIFATLAVTNQYPNVHFFYPRDVPLSQVKKQMYSLKWNADAQTLRPAHDQTRTWREGMNKPDVRFIVQYLSLNGHSGFHANVVIYDKQKNAMEVFDPMGQEVGGSYKAPVLYRKIRSLYTRGKNPLVPKDVKFMTPRDYCPPSRVFQSREVDEVSNIGIGGACAVWRLWWTHIRIANPDVEPKVLVRVAMRAVRRQESLTLFIRSYQKYIIHLVKKAWPDRKAKTRTV